MNDEQRFTIGELAEQAQITPRTIRYYTAEGVLPPPDTRGRYALYSIDHLQRLRLINRLKLSHLPLNEIGARLNQLGTHEVEQLLSDEQAATAPHSAIEYLSHVLDRPASSRRMVREQSAVPTAMYGQLPTSQCEQPSAAAQSFSIRERKQEQNGEQRPAPRPASFFKRPDTMPEMGAEAWQRITLAPGVELHIQSNVMHQMQQQVKQLQQQAKELFGEQESPAP